MYITIAKGNNNVIAQHNFIDDLFNGETEIIIPEIVERPIIRTKTHCVDNFTSDAITYEMFLFFYATVKHITEAHPNPEDEYTTFSIPKKTHGFRTINAPYQTLKEDQKKLANMLQYYLKILPHDSAWAYTQGRDVVHAMHEHTDNGSRWYLKLDLHDFFGSCNKEFIIQQLKKIYPFAVPEKYGADIIDDTLNKLTDLAILNGGLPQGTPLSPILTNLIMVEYDYKINKLLYNLSKDKIIKQKYIYTRYADDIIISARNKFDYKIIVDAIKELFADTPLVLNEEKTRFGSSSGRNWNLGVMCTKDNRTTVGYRRKHQLKAMLNNYIKDRKEGNTWSLDDLYYLQGQLSWLYNVEPKYYKGFIDYINNKYDVTVIQCIKYDIKSYSN